MSSLSPNRLFDLSGRIALVSGGGTGIGLHIARGLGAAGAKVYIGGRRRDVLDKVVADWDTSAYGKVVALTLDVSDKESISTARDYIQREEGKLHILVNNAGQTGPVSNFLNNTSAPEHASADALGRALFANESFEAWDALFRVNTTSLFFTTTAFIGLLDAGSTPNWPSSVINITSISGIVKLAQNHFSYNASKAAASHITRMFATELALKGINIRANSIAPGVYASEMTQAQVTDVETVQAISQALVPVPAARAGTEEEIAGTAVYLASRAGSYVNGQELVVDGGYIAVNPSTV